MRFVALAMAMMVGTYPVAAQDPGAQKLFNLMFDATGPVLKWAYHIEVTLAFDYRGEALHAHQAYRCEVFHDRGTIDVQRDRVVGTTSGSANLHFVLSDGTALVLFNFNPCRWTSLPPLPGTVYHLYPVARSDRPLAEPVEMLQQPIPPAAAPPVDVMGSIAVIDDAIAPSHVVTHDLASFIQNPEVANFQLSAASTVNLPTNDLAADIPALAPFPYSPDYDDQPIRGALFFSVTMETRRLDPAQDPELAKHAKETHWVVAEGTSVDTGAPNAKASIGSDPSRIEIDLAPTPPTETGMMLQWAARAWPAGQTRRWPLDLCIEGDCLRVKAWTSSFFGRNTSFYTLYHPPTGRLVGLTIGFDDLSRLYTSDDVSELFN